MRRRLIAAAIFVGILLLLLWFSQASADAATRKVSRPKPQPQPCITVVLDDSRAVHQSTPEGEVEWDPIWVDGFGGGDFSDLKPVWDAAMDYGYIGFFLGLLILLRNIFEWRREFVRLGL